MSWLSLATGLVQLASYILGWLHDKKAIQQGEDRALAREAKALIQRTSVAREIELEFTKKTPEEIQRELEGDFRD